MRCIPSDCNLPWRDALLYLFPGGTVLTGEHVRVFWFTTCIIYLFVVSSVNSSSHLCCCARVCASLFWVGFTLRAASCSAWHARVRIGSAGVLISWYLQNNIYSIVLSDSNEGKAPYTTHATCLSATWQDLKTSSRKAPPRPLQSRRPLPDAGLYIQKLEVENRKRRK